MRTLVYKRTHNDDPNAQGQFGVYDCMGRWRATDYEAVIGVGGVGPEARKNRIAGKVNWIGIGARKTIHAGKRGPLVTFDHFRDFGTEGPDFLRIAPTLASRMYSRNVRAVLELNSRERAEVNRILALARKAPPSAAGPVRERLGGRTPSKPGRKRVKGCST